MMKYILISFLCLAGASSVFGQTLDEYWEFTNLYASDDSSGTTHLYYAQQNTRIHNCDDRIYENRSTIHRYHNSLTNVDSVFIPTHNYVTMPGCSGGGGVSIADFHPFDGNPENVVLYGGYSDGFEPYGYLQVGNGNFYLTPLFGYFEKVVANPKLGKFIFLPFSEYTVRIPHTTNQDTLNVLNDFWHEWMSYRDSEADPPDSLNSYFKNYEFNLYSLSRFNDSLAFYQKAGSLYRSEDLEETGETLNVDINQNSNFHYDADSLHIYVTQEGANSIFISDDYGKKGSWSSFELPSFSNFFSIDSKTPGLVFYADSSRIYRSNNFGASFELIHEFDKKITGLYKKPASNVLYVLFEQKLVELHGEVISQLKKAPEKKHLHIDINDLPYNIGNEFTFRVYEFEQLSDDSYKHTPVEDFKMKVKEIIVPLSSSQTKQIFFKNSTAHPLFSELIFDDNNIIADQWINRQDQVLIKNKSESFSPWIVDSEDNSVLNLAIIRGIGRRYFLGIYDTTATIDYYVDTNADSLAKMGESKARLAWSNTFGVKDVYFWEDSSRYRYNLKGAVIEGTVYGDTTQTYVVSNQFEPTEIPTQISLQQNYPNPFNPSTVIRYQLAGNSLVRLEVFDVTGRKVAVLVDGERKSAGSHRVTFEASGLSSGVYFYRLQTGGQTFTQKMMLVK